MTVKTKVHPFLMFQGNAEEAMNFYVSLFPGGEVSEVVRYGPGQAGAEGSIMKAAFALGGERALCSDSVVKHDFTFTPATTQHRLICPSACPSLRLVSQNAPPVETCILEDP
jgi:predicted 3-demethylubiquinone-9 3-methyltransferase (glyoxalase superfamily)